MSFRPEVRFLDRSTAPHISTLILMTGISALTMSIFLPSLNGMAQYFETEYAVMQLAVSGYLAATAVLQVIVGPLSDRFGRRRVILTALALFVIATIGAITAPNVETFLFFRLLQAVVATSMALSRAIIRDMVPQDEAASMIGYVTMGMALVPMIGPMIGGVLDETFGWQASFVFLALAGIGVLALCYFDQGETVAAGGLPFREQLRSYPELLTSPRFWGYSLCACFASGAFFALLGGASFIAGTVFGLSPIWSGVALGMPAVGYAIGNFFTGRYAARVGVNRMALIGTVIVTIGMTASWVLGLAGLNSPLIFFGFCTFLGLGNGIVLPNTMAGSVSVRPHLAGTASGLSGAIMVGGGAALAALSGAMLTEASGALPLQLVMMLTSAASVLSIALVIWRERQIQG